MEKKKIAVMAGMLIFLAAQITITGTPAGTLRPFGSDKIWVSGHSQFLGYLNAYVQIKKGGLPMLKQNVFLDSLKLRDLSDGRYSNGTPYVYDIAAHKLIIIKLVPKPALITPREKPEAIVLGTYQVNNHIEWVYPLPNSKISVNPLMIRNLIFKWNYTGKTLSTKVRIKNFTTNTEVFSRTVTAEQISIPARLFIKGNRYRFDLESDGPVGLFKLTKETAPGSKIEFFYWDHIYFDVK